jgi:hypothetical protein
MVATTSPSPPPSESRSGTAESPRLQQDDVEQAEHEHGKSGVRHLVAAASKLASLQFKIMMTKLKLTMMRIAISVGLYIGAAVFGILAVILLLVGIFHVLLIWLPPWAAYLIFAGALAVLAVTMILIASKMIGGKDEDDDDDDDRNDSREDRK